MVEIRVLGPVHVDAPADGGVYELQPLELSLVVALALTTERPGETRRLGGLTDIDLARAVWNNATLSRNVQKTINHLNSNTAITINREDRRRYLVWAEDAVDYHVFTAIQAQARATADLREKFKALGSALELVKGVPLDGLNSPPSGWVEVKRREITAEVCDATVQWLEAAILLNEHVTVLDKACQIHNWFPKDELVCRYLIYLLYRSGRRARALECYDTTVAAHSGTPSVHLTDLYRIIETGGDIVRATELLDLKIPSSGMAYRHRFSFAEVGEFLARLVGAGSNEQSAEGIAPSAARAIREWRPDLIVGINRGGSIVGGFLAKHFDLNRVVPITILWRTDDDGHREYYVAAPPVYEADHPDDDPDSVKRILLTDEVFRTGNHVRFARRVLRATFPQAEIRVAALVSVRQDLSYGEGPGRGGIGGPTYYGQLVGSRNFALPWDP